MWKRELCFDPTCRFEITSDSFTIYITGGSVIIKDKTTGELLKRIKGHHYLYTGDINPDETECFALENGKHFYVYSLKNYELIKRITLPRFYDSIDMFGSYSDDGKFIYIPVQRWVKYEKKKDSHLGRYKYELCKYETENYTLVDKTDIESQKEYDAVRRFCVGNASKYFFG